MSATQLKRRSLRDELAFLLDSTVDLPPESYDRETLLMRLEAAVLNRVRRLVGRGVRAGMKSSSVSLGAWRTITNRILGSANDDASDETRREIAEGREDR